MALILGPIWVLVALILGSIWVQSGPDSDPCGAYFGLVAPVALMWRLFRGPIWAKSRFNLGPIWGPCDAFLGAYLALFLGGSIWLHIGSDSGPCDACFVPKLDPYGAYVALMWRLGPIGTKTVPDLGVG